MTPRLPTYSTLSSHTTSACSLVSSNAPSHPVLSWAVNEPFPIGAPDDGPRGHFWSEAGETVDWDVCLFFFAGFWFFKREKKIS